METTETYQLLSDDALVEKFQQGDNKAFQILIGKYKNVLYGLCVRLNHGNIHDTQDLIQEVCIKIVLAISKTDYFRIGNFKNWMRAIAFKTFATEYRKKQTHSNIDLDDEDCASIALESDTPEKIYLRKEFIDAVETVLQEFASCQQEVFRLEFYKNLTYQEIAEQLSLSNDNIRVIMHRIRKKLKKSLRNAS